MERSSKHGPKKDDELKRATQHQARTGRMTRSTEWRDPEALERDEESPRKQRRGKK
ncbi:hypothetical protein [Streptomyces morookaense]|uniref:Uncharacterized protein n=1 Tax=Streptomyces morookaense TaxID=1970 RepID=A0A7Y7B8I2_STRMO|nr:hypothetical protein [Streptomyces morookaense]NVK80946.1 hypothetical protein [Streptomyces morookaense]GHF40712.1 hypothetical protein GCM10010359_49140 [Streptomyces morookaense]